MKTFEKTVCSGLFLLLSLIAFGFLPAWAGEGRLLRFPDISTDKVAFVYANDIWLAPREGGQAVKLTSHEGQEWFPKFSPDGKWIAFTGDYDGNREVYVIPASGGEPKRLTFMADLDPGVSERMGPNNAVLGWTPDGKIVFRSRRDQWNAFMGRPYVVSPKGGMPEALPIPYAGLVSFSPDGKRIAYNPTWREFRTWKRYRGGMAQDIYLYDLDSHKQERITDFDGVDDFPMWSKNTIYFLSERDRRANLYAYDLGSKQTRKLTSFQDFDIKFPSLGSTAIVFEMGGELHLYDLKNGKLEKIRIDIPSDKILARPHFINAAPYITEFGLAPDGKRALFNARGEIFTVPAEKGEVRNISQSSGARERNLDWSPDGRFIAYLSDQTGEYELNIRSQDGRQPPVQITKGGDCMKFHVLWSPDSKKLLFADKNLRLFWVDVEKKATTLIDTARAWEIREYAWSPDSRFVAYAKPEANGMRAIHLYNLDNKTVTKVSTEVFDDFDPIFDPDGRYLFFLSRRDFNPIPAWLEANFLYTQLTKPYALTLRADEPSPFAPQSDETATGKPGEKKSAKDEDPKAQELSEERGQAPDQKKPKPVAPMRIDLAGISARIAAFPVAPGNYVSLRAAPDRIFYVADPIPTMTGKPGNKTLWSFDLKKRKAEEVLASIDGYELSANGKKLLIKTKGKFYLLDAKPKQKLGEENKPLRVGDLPMFLDPPAEWRQIFVEAWRQERDYFYAANMHQVDWKALKDRYGALLPHLAHRADLAYLIGEMIGELGASHTYVGGGEAPRPKPVSIGQLGAELLLDSRSGRYRIERLLEGQNWDKLRKSPLTEPGLNIKPGDYLLAIDGKELRDPTVPESLLQSRAGKQTSLLINSRPEVAGSREVVAVPISHEWSLRYHDWAERNRRLVEQKSKGQVGYVHIPDMGGNGLNQFSKMFYPQIRKKALIIDVRWNAGGSVSQMILERLRRVLAGMSAPRNALENTYPRAVHVGPKVCLLNEWSASDGDIFPHFFRRFGLGKLVGKRSWGGVVGIRGIPDLVDGGYVFTPEFALYDLNSTWILENRGVEPDIEVENLPGEVLLGKDAQLERAIDMMMEELSKKATDLPARPADPTDR